MSLSSSLFTGTSGLKNMGNALQVVGNNISNLNTIGFKKGRTTFADTLYESVATQAGGAQVGRGMAVGDVAQNFGQGSFESTGNTTDLSIGGDGFFIMRQSNSENTFYTRAGNFFFNKAGQLVNPEGYIVQGWNLDEETGDDIGSITDLVLSAFTSPPKKTESMTAITILNADANSEVPVLANLWDAGNTTPMASGNYEYQTPVQVYDALGSRHDITIYYDKKSGTEWEYVIAMNPEEDNRNLVQGTDSKGLLARGTILFSQSSGDILDMTMSEFTGRIGNFKATGVNTVDNVNYEISDYNAMQLDGYGFSLEFDGSTWNFSDINGDSVITSADLPDNYKGAKIVYSDSTNIHLTLTPDSTTDVDPDLRIKLDKPAVSTNTIGFDINDANSLHVQGIFGSDSYFGDAEGNTTLEIDNPGVMDKDSDGLSIIWNPTTETWHWNNPEDANSAGTLVTGLTTTAGTAVDTSTATITVANAPAFHMVSEDINVRYDGRTNDWDWNMPMKVEDFTNEAFNFGGNNPTLTIQHQGTEGAIMSADGLGTPTTITLTWDGVNWAGNNGGGTNNILVVGANSDESQVELGIWEGAASAGGSVIRYTFSSPLSTTPPPGQTITFNIDPAPPQEYPSAVITTSGVAAGTEGIGIDFDSDNTTDLIFDVTAGSTVALADGNSLNFDINPDTPPKEYSNATLKGDETEAVLDLDGSGNESDKRDVVFSFTNPLRKGSLLRPYADRSEIYFDIDGSTAWTEISKNDITKTGYFAFNTDFLGGEFGSTETDIEFNIGTRYDGVNFVNDSSSTVQYSRKSTTIFYDADGYAAGDLEGVDVASDGIITGVYSNGQLIPLFRVGLAKFRNNYGLSNEGGNLFRETRESGGAVTNKPGENGLGTLAPNSLEMSNVDISEEFVSLITQQRGFQANSKTITTVDEMMNTVIQMKR